MATSGYSKTPLVKKLGIKEGFQVLYVNEPKQYQKLLVDCPEIYPSDAQTVESVDFIHLFCTQIEEFEQISLQLKPLLKKSGMLWVSWPKGSSKLKTDLSRDYIRTFLIRKGLVDIKICAIDDDWSGLKFVYRLNNRK